MTALGLGGDAGFGRTAPRTTPEWIFERGPIADWLRPQLWSKKNARDAWAKVVTFLAAHLKK